MRYHASLKPHSFKFVPNKLILRMVMLITEGIIKDFTVQALWLNEL